jgi:alkylation response protein AidB-like acyl-CoA dehydrogenase
MGCTLEAGQPGHIILGGLRCQRNQYYRTRQAKGLMQAPHPKYGFPSRLSVALRQTETMNFDFSDDARLLRDQARRFLKNQAALKSARRVLEGQSAHDADLWNRVGGLGWPGSAIPEEFGGAGLGYEGLCVLAEELGRSLAPVPFSSTAYFACEAIRLAGSAAQQKRLLPELAAGRRIGTFALAEGPGNPDPARLRAAVVRGRLTGAKLPVADGDIADLCIVAAQDEGRGVGLFLCELNQPGVRHRTLKTIDPTRNHARLDFESADVEPLVEGARGWDLVRRLMDRVAILIAFEQVGGAQACLEMAKTYAL